MGHAGVVGTRAPERLSGPQHPEASKLPRRFQVPASTRDGSCEGVYVLTVPILEVRLLTAPVVNHIISTSQPPLSIAHTQESSRVPIQLSASSPSADAVERMVIPPSQNQSTSAAQHRSSALSYLLNADISGATALRSAIAEELRSSSPDARAPVNSLP
jgi:hypothetical protein